MIRTLLIFTHLLAVFTCLKASGCPEKIYFPEPDFNGAMLNGEPIKVFEDRNDTLSLFELIDWCEKGKPFKTLEHYQFGLSTSAQWLVFSIENKDSFDRQFILELVDPYLYEFQIHLKSNHNELISDTLSLKDNFNTRKRFKNIGVKNHQNFLFNLDLERDERVTCYLNFKPSKQLLNFRLYLWDEDYRLTNQKGIENVILSSFFLLCVLYLFILGVSIFITGFKYFWYYFFYVLFGTLFIFADLGLGYRFVWSEFTFCQQLITPVLANIYLVFGTLFVRAYFNTRHNFPYLEYILLLIIFLALSLVPLSLMIPVVDELHYAHTLYRFATVLYATACLTFFWILFDSTFRSRKFYLWAISFWFFLTWSKYHHF